MTFLRGVSIILLFVISYSLEADSKQIIYRSGVCISFDDRSIEEWYNMLPLLKRYQVNCTFYITQPQLLSKEQIKMVKEIQNLGHEIACHGYQHVLAENYIRKYGYNKYLQDEIHPFLSWAKQQDLEITTFAYPYGSKFWLTDFILLNYFENTRSVAIKPYGKMLHEGEEYFYSGSQKRLAAISFDTNSNLTIDEVKLAIQKAMEDNEVLMLYGHVPTCNVHEQGYFFDLDFFEEILKTIHELNIPTYRSFELN